MRQSEDKLTFMQTLIMVSSTMIGAGVLTLPRSAAETDSPIGWIMILLQGVIFIIFALLFLPFLQRNSERTIFELNSIAAGKLIGFFLNVFISIYFIGIVCFQARVLGEVVGFFLLKNTPMAVVVFIFLAVAIYHVAGGVYPIAKVYAYIFPITIIIFLMLLMFSSRLFQLDFIRPVFEGGYRSFSLYFLKLFYIFQDLKSFFISFPS